MRTIITILILAAALHGYAQDAADKAKQAEIPMNSAPLSYSDVVTVDSSLKKDVLFSRARIWFSQNFNSSKDVLDVQDKENGELIGNGTIYFSPGKMAYECFTGYIRFQIQVYVKDGRYKYAFQSFVHEADKQYSMGDCNLRLITTDTQNPYAAGRVGQNGFNKMWTMAKDQIENKILMIIQSLYDTMSKKPQSTEW